MFIWSDKKEENLRDIAWILSPNFSFSFLHKIPIWSSLVHSTVNKELHCGYVITNSHVSFYLPFYSLFINGVIISFFLPVIPSSATADDSDADEWGLVLDSNISSGKLNSVSSFGNGRLSRSSWINQIQHGGQFYASISISSENDRDILCLL